MLHLKNRLSATLTFLDFYQNLNLKNLTRSKETDDCRNVNATANSCSDILRLILIQFQPSRQMLGALVLKIHLPPFALSVTLRYEHQIKISFVRLKSAKLLATISSNSIRNCLVTRKFKNVRFSAPLFFTRPIPIIIVVCISTIEFQTRLLISLFYLPVCIILSHTGKTRGKKVTRTTDG